MSTMTYTFISDGLEVVVTAEEIMNEDGTSSVKLSFNVIEGSLDLNAIWWSNGDDEADFDGFTKKDSSLNMNGEGSLLDGEAVLWDGAHKIGSPGTDKNVLEAGDTFEITLDGLTLEDMAILGIRATSVGEDQEGSVKLVAAGEGIEEPPVGDDDNFEEWGGGGQDGLPEISHITLYWKVEEGDWRDVSGENREPDGWFTVKFDYTEGAQIGGNYLSQDLDDDIGAFLEFLVAEGKIDNDEKSQLVGVAIKGGQEELWYDYFEGNTDPSPDPENAPDVFVVENNQLDLAYEWTIDTNTGDGVWG